MRFLLRTLKIYYRGIKSNIVKHRQNSRLRRSPTFYSATHSLLHATIISPSFFASPKVINYYLEIREGRTIHATTT